MMRTLLRKGEPPAATEIPADVFADALEADASKLTAAELDELWSRFNKALNRPPAPVLRLVKGDRMD